MFSLGPWKVVTPQKMPTCLKMVMDAIRQVLQRFELHGEAIQSQVTKSQLTGLLESVDSTGEGGSQPIFFSRPLRADVDVVGEYLLSSLETSNN